jgi:hypothetical protein
MPLYIALLFVLPGIALSYLYCSRGDRLFPTAIYSLGIFLLNVEIANQLIGMKNLLALYLAECLVGLFLVLRRASSQGIRSSLAVRDVREGITHLWVFAIIVVVATLYTVWANPYLEVPTDVYSHLGAVQHYQHRLSAGYLDSGSPWYQLFALGNYWGSTKIYAQLESFTWLASVWFLGSFYTIFIAVIGHYYRLSAQERLFGLVATILTAVIFGTSVFSFFRYYIFAPAYVTFPIFLYLAALSWRLFESKKSADLGIFKTTVLISIGIWVLYCFHRQEALFLLLFLFGLSAYVGSEKIIYIYQRSQFRQRAALALSAACVMLLGVVIGIAAMVSYGMFEKTSPLANNLIDIGSTIRVPLSILIGDPSGRIYETYGAFGVFVVLSYFLILKPKERPTFFSVLFIVPIATIFNPVFVALFLYWSEQDVVWRISYMAPVGLCAVYIAYALFRRRVHSGSAKSLINFGAYCLVLVLLIIPYSSTQALQQLRYSTLSHISDANDYRNWQDLIQELQKYRHRHVLTDPITGYIISAMTDNRTFGFKFHGTGGFLDLNVPDYGRNSFEDYIGWLIVLNQRDGGFSSNGDQSGHWPGDTLMVSQFYSPKLVEFLVTPPPHIRKIWEGPLVKVFEVIEKRQE